VRLVPHTIFHLSLLFQALLESQTDLIVQNIQTLLYAMRQESFGEKCRDTINGITSVVENLVSVCRDTLSKQALPSDQRQRGQAILGDLTASNSKLSELGMGMLTTNNSKPSKQKLAAAAYEVAKSTKELVSLFELDS
jgi:hypothetical protein